MSLPSAVPDTASLFSPVERQRAITAVLMAILLGALDQSIVSVALPTMARQLGGFEWMPWVVSGYLIASTVSSPLYGKFGDLYGRRAVLTVSISVFLVASVLCSLAQTMPQLVAARVLQGAGGGGLIVLAQSVIADIVPMRDRGRYQSYVSVVWATANVGGPVIGGVLTQFLPWSWIFWVNLPIGLWALWLIRGTLGRLPVRPGRPRIDWLGALLLLVGLTALLVPISRLAQGTPWNDLLNLCGWGAALLLLVLFIRHERGHPEPIVPLSLFGNAVVVRCITMLFICFFVFIALTVLVPLRLQLIGGHGSAAAALRLLPLTLGIPAAAFIGGRWMQSTGRVRPLQRLGVLLVPAALVALALSGPGGVVSSLALLVLGAGVGLQLPTTLITVQQSVPKSQIGIATALTAFSRLLGGAVGVAVLSSVVLYLLREHLPGGSPFTVPEGPIAIPGLVHLDAASNALTDSAFHAIMWIAAVVSCVSVACARGLPDVRLNDPADAEGRR